MRSGCACATSAYWRSDASGDLSSCEASEMKRRCAACDSSSRASMPFIVCARRPISSRGARVVDAAGEVGCRGHRSTCRRIRSTGASDAADGEPRRERDDDGDERHRDRQQHADRRQRGVAPPRCSGRRRRSTSPPSRSAAVTNGGVAVFEDDEPGASSRRGRRARRRPPRRRSRRRPTPLSRSMTCQNRSSSRSGSASAPADRPARRRPRHPAAPTPSSCAVERRAQGEPESRPPRQRARGRRRMPRPP